MKTRTILLAMVLFVAVISTKAQVTVTTTGGEAGGSGGTASYTVGQVFYTISTGTSGNTVTQGVQQPYEISNVTGIKEAKDIDIKIFAYPNPAIDYLIVKVKNYKTEYLQYLVFDINGKLLQSIKATGMETKIRINSFVPASYFVKVTDNNREIKVFKIVKN